uniref:Uncharacterized protein n=1 Tax=Syphacia muris TaxID=451379 RepID=A0A0N5AAT5_9BILA
MTWDNKLMPEPTLSTAFAAVDVKLSKTSDTGGIYGNNLDGRCAKEGPSKRKTFIAGNIFRDCGCQPGKKG